MADLICSAITSFDGYVEDADGGFDSAAPDEEVHAFVNDLERSYPEEGHGIRAFPATIDASTRAVAWFERFMPSNG